MHRRQGLTHRDLTRRQSLNGKGLAGTLAALTLTGCAGAVAVPAAERSTDPACSRALVAIRGAEDLAGHPRRETTSQATAVWGDSGEITLRCGLPPLGPSTDPCQTVGGVDWVIRQADGRTTFTAYGRSPTLQVGVDGLTPTGTDLILTTMGPAAQALPATGRRCL